jgi:hypothetical protein
MSTKRYVFDPAQGKVVEYKDRWIPASEAPFVISDTLPMTKSPLNGKLYFESKSALRKHYKQHGYEEIGNDYENGSIERMEKEYAREMEAKTDAKIKQNLIDRVIHGKR